MYNHIYREPDSLDAKLRYQIDTLKIFNENVTEVLENEEYKVDFENNGKLFSLKVKLSPMFPLYESPSIFISPLVDHPWVSPSGEIVSAPGLLNFTVHSDLGRVVQAIIREFSYRLLRILSNENSPPSSSGQVLNLPSSNSHPHHSGPYTTNELNYDNPFTNKSSIFPELNNLTIAQLKELNENSNVLDSFIENLRGKMTLSNDIVELIETTDKMAQINLNKGPELEQLQEELTSLNDELQIYKEKYEMLSSKYKECCDQFNPHRIIENIRESMADIDEESEKVAESFLKGDMDLDSFLYEYINRRTISHSRKVKDEKLSQQLEKLHQAGY